MLNSMLNSGIHNINKICISHEDDRVGISKKIATNRKVGRFTCGTDWSKSSGRKDARRKLKNFKLWKTTNSLDTYRI